MDSETEARVLQYEQGRAAREAVARPAAPTGPLASPVLEAPVPAPISVSALEGEPSVGEYLEQMNLPVVSDVTFETPAVSMTQDQLEAELDTLYKLAHTDEVLGSPALLSRVQARMTELQSQYVGPLERAFTTAGGVLHRWFTTSDEEAEQMDKERLQRTEDIVRAVGPVN
jgi:hypothetical protein